MTQIKPLQASAKAAKERRRLLSALAALAAASLPMPVLAKPDLRVGPNEKVRSLAEAARLARDGWLIEVAAGEYRADVASWRRDGLRLRAVGGRVRLVAEGAQSEGKGLFVVNGRSVEIEGFDFSGASVRDRNGAGVRFESGSMIVRDCSFSDCEMGLITSNEGSARLVVEDCEFSRPRLTEGFSHLLYVGRIAHLEVRGCHFHDGAHGHLLKSRAGFSRVEYNRFLSGRASYELEFPNGGRVRVIGNLIEQSRDSENPLMLSYGAEGFGWPRNELDLAHNSWIDRLGGTPVRVASGGQTQVRAFNNLLIGRRPWRDQAGWQAAGNQQIPPDGARTPALAVPLPPELMPTHQVGEPLGLRRLAGPARRTGALQDP